jgi:hypothetical protein
MFIKKEKYNAKKFLIKYFVINIINNENLGIIQLEMKALEN